MTARRDWPTFLMDHARLAARQAKDSTQVGAALARGRSCLLTAYNGPPAGVLDLPDRFERPRKYLFAAHAERNLISFAARHGIRTEGCTVYCTHAPCAGCAGAMIQAGIACVAYGDGTTSMPADEFEAARDMLHEAGVQLIPYRDLEVTP